MPGPKGPPLIRCIQGPEGPCSLLHKEIGRAVRRPPEVRADSDLNAISPYDFKIVSEEGTHRVLDAKSTSSGFLNPIHLSLGEIYAATEGAEPYDIYRVFKVTESSAILRIALDVGPALRPVVEVLLALPNGVAVDSLSVDPGILPFESAEIALSLPEEDAAEN